MTICDGLKGKVQTVLGPISPDDLGITLPHEHCLIDLTVLFKEPVGEKEKALAYQPVTLENIGWVRTHFNNNLDNMNLSDENVAIEALEEVTKWPSRLFDNQLKASAQNFDQNQI